MLLHLIGNFVMVYSEHIKASQSVFVELLIVVLKSLAMVFASLDNYVSMVTYSVYSRNLP